MQVVKIKNLNKSHMKKPFVVKGRIKYLKVDNNRSSSGNHLNSILFDDNSEIEIVAFKDCENISKLLETDKVVAIENCLLREVNKDYKKTKHKYKIILEPNSIITTLNNDEVNNTDFPIHKYTKGAELKTLIPGMIIDVIGVCTLFESEKSVNSQDQIYRRGMIMVDSTEIEFRVFGEKVDQLYDVGSTLILSSVKYINFKGTIFLSVGFSSSIKCNPQQLSNGIDMKDSTIELPNQKLSTLTPTQSNKNLVVESTDQRPSTSGSTPSNKNFVFELTDQKPSTSGSTPSNKRRTQDFNGEEVNSKILKITEPEELSFSDERFVSMMLTFMQQVKNNKDVVKLRIVEFISEILKENE